MILVDTSVWIDHLHAAEPGLSELLQHDRVCCHSAIIEELALGSIAHRAEFLGALSGLRKLAELTHDELRAFVDLHRLWGRGLSPADVRLLGSVLLSPGVRLSTRDKRLHTAAGVVGVPLFDEQ